MITIPAVTLGVEEYQYGVDGVVINDDPSLPFVDITAITGVDGGSMRTQTRDREGMEGGYVDAEFESVRNVVMEGVIYADPFNTESYLDSLKLNYAPSRDPKPFYIGTDAGTRVLVGKSLGLNYVKSNARGRGIIPFTVTIACEDPRFYTPGVISSTETLVAGVSTGRGYNKSYSFGYGPAATSNSFSITVGGNRATPAYIRIDGPVVDPVIVNESTGDTLSFQLTVADDSYIEIDTYNKSVILNGVGSARNTMTLAGKWFLLQPGTTSFRFLGIQDPPSPAATATVSAYPSWR